MHHKNKKLGFSLIEILVVMTIIATLSLIILISFRDSKVEVVLDATVEVLEDNFSSLRTRVIAEEYNIVEVYFDLQNPMLYSQSILWEYGGVFSDSFAKNVIFDSVAEVSSVSDGSVGFSWDAPLNGSDAQVYVYGDNKKIKTYPESGTSVSSPWSYLGVNHYQSYDFEFVFPDKKKALYKLSLNYFSKENISVDGGSFLYLEKIEAQDFSDNWLNVTQGTMKILSPFGQLKFFSGGNEYKNIRLTFSRQGKTLTYNLR